jgi:hypothetical protein
MFGLSILIITNCVLISIENMLEHWRLSRCGYVTNKLIQTPATRSNMQQFIKDHAKDDGQAYPGRVAMMKYLYSVSEVDGIFSNSRPVIGKL